MSDFDFSELSIDDLAALRFEQVELLDSLADQHAASTDSTSLDAEVLSGWDIINAVDTELADRL